MLSVVTSPTSVERGGGGMIFGLLGLLLLFPRRTGTYFEFTCVRCLEILTYKSSWRCFFLVASSNIAKSSSETFACIGDDAKVQPTHGTDELAVVSVVLLLHGISFESRGSSMPYDIPIHIHMLYYCTHKK